MTLTAEDMDNFLEGSGWDFAYSASRDQYYCHVCREWIPGSDTQEGLRKHARTVHGAMPLENRYHKERDL
jgi:hypothetical protein